MPTLPSAKRRPWQPAPTKPVYQQHAARDSRYDTARWQAARKAQIARCPCCVVCTSQGRTTAATVTDHTKPVRLGGDFWEPGNHQSLCRPATRLRARQSGYNSPNGGRGSKSSGVITSTP
jgi:5-methylcytosine-specific restriction protein A